MFVPKRFSIRALFVIIAVVACALVFYQDWQRLQKGRDEYSAKFAAWEAGREGIEDIVKYSESLMRVEAASMWMSLRQSQHRHVNRVRTLLDDAEVGMRTTMYSDPRAFRQKLERLRTEISKFEALAK